jgi:drug/metabolite transporter superfamily protein YnfA
MYFGAVADTEYIETAVCVLPQYQTTSVKPSMGRVGAAGYGGIFVTFFMV